MTMDPSIVRAPTPDELKALEWQIKEGHRCKTGVAYSVAAGVGVSLVPLQGVALVLLLSLIGLSVIITWMRLSRDLSRKLTLLGAGEIAKFEGQFRRKTVTLSRGRIVIRYFVGDLSVGVPAHWLRHVRDGDRVSVEALLYDVVAHPMAELVSLRGRRSLSLGQEVAAGLLGLSTNISPLMAILWALCSAAFATLLAFTERPLPFLLQKLSYDNTQPKVFDNVEDALASAGGPKASRVVIARAAIAPGTEAGRIVAFDPTRADEVAIREAGRRMRDEIPPDRRQLAQQAALSRLYAVLTSGRPTLRLTAPNKEADSLRAQALEQALQAVALSRTTAPGDEPWEDPDRTPLIIRLGLEGRLVASGEEGVPVLDVRFADEGASPYALADSMGLLKIVLGFMAGAVALGIHGALVFFRNRAILKALEVLLGVAAK